MGTEETLSLPSFMYVYVISNQWEIIYFDSVVSNNKVHRLPVT